MEKRTNIYDWANVAGMKTVQASCKFHIHKLISIHTHRDQSNSNHRAYQRKRIDVLILPALPIIIHLVTIKTVFTLGRDAKNNILTARYAPPAECAVLIMRTDEKGLIINFYLDYSRIFRSFCCHPCASWTVSCIHERAPCEQETQLHLHQF